jgi:hypothetical protein
MLHQKSWRRSGINRAGSVIGLIYLLDITLLYKDHKDWMPKHPLAPSIDKIDVNGDYTKENIVICTRFANFGRNVCEFDKFHEIVDILQGKQSTRIIEQLSLFN